MEIKFIDVKYQNIFDSLNLVINENQITSLVGKNGSGKTSFFKLICGIELNFDGEILIDDEIIKKRISEKQLDRIREKVSYLPQDYHCELFNINILEDIKYFLKGVLINDKMKILYEYLKAFDLNENILKKNYSDISSNELKKILIIISIIKDNKIILLDDPTNGLDYKAQNTLIKILKKEKRKGKIIIVSSQDSEFLLKVSDRIILLNNKKIIEKSDKYEFLENKQISRKSGLEIPNILKFRQNTLERKSLKLMYRDNINDLIKDIYRNA